MERFKRTLIGFFGTFGLFGGLLFSAHTLAQDVESRLALVIGISQYQYAPELLNPVDDAKAMAAQLEALDFEVELVLDADNRTLASALRNFGIRAANVDVSLIFYAGHGVQVDGQNYLIPADARLQRARDLLYEAMPLNFFLGEASQSRQLGMVILDACRDNPFVDKLIENMGVQRANAVGNGLGRVDDTPSDTLVAMATRANAVAEDGTGDHSPYTQALLDELENPGLELGLFFRRVRDRVLQSTQGRQEPYTFGSLGAEPFYFTPLPPNREPEIGEAEPVILLDDATATPLGVPAPTDPDEDRMVVQVSGLPQGGTVSVGDRILLIGDYLTIEQLKAARFDPDGSYAGSAGAFEYLVSDGRGGLSRGAVAIQIDPANRPPEIPSLIVAQVAPTPLAIPMPEDPDGDALTITVRTIPDQGKVRSGENVLSPGDRISLEELASLTFDVENATVGEDQELTLAIADGRGGIATTRIRIGIIESDNDSGGVSIDAEIWRQVTQRPDAAAFGAYLTLFPDGVHAAQARIELANLEPEQEDTPSPATDQTDSEIPVALSQEPPDPEPASPDTLLEPLGVFRVVTASNVRDGPSTDSNRIDRFAAGVEVEVLGRSEDGRWYIIQNDGQSAFIYSSLLEKIESEPEETEVAVVALDAPVPEPESGLEPESENTEILASAPSERPRTRSNGGLRDCPECPELVTISPGEFTMGRSDGERTERPAHRVRIDSPYLLGRYEVTVAEWRACVNAGGCFGMPRFLGDVTDRTPVHNLHWDDVNEYLRWLSALTGRNYRLPSEAEWEYAARAGSQGPYWWGSSISGGYVVCQTCGDDYNRLRPNEVGSRPENPFGLHEMNGGVWEWVQDCWIDDYIDAPDDGSARESGSCQKRTLRGGSWRDGAVNLTATTRVSYDHNVRYFANGFRVARDIE